MPKVLFVSMPGVTHAAQWVSQLRATKWDVHFFPSHSPCNYIDTFRDLTIYSKQKLPHCPKAKGITVKSIIPLFSHRLLKLSERAFPDRFDLPRWLARTIDQTKPDIVHSMEIQRGAYLVDEAKKHLKTTMPKWVVTPWGSDLYLYRNLSEHVEKLKSVLAQCDYFWPECQRDYQFATDLGFKGKQLQAVPASGGFQSELNDIDTSPVPSQRKTIMLKGYQSFSGRALNAFTAMKSCKELLQGYTIVLYLSSHAMDVAAELFSKETGIPVKTLRFPLPHEEILSHFANARIHIGLSISDGLPTSVIESMALGAYPIQSDSCCANEWIENGKNGSLIPAEDVPSIAEAIKRALSDDALVDQAATQNKTIASEQFGYDKIRAKVLKIYDSI